MALGWPIGGFTKAPVLAPRTVPRQFSDPGGSLGATGTPTPLSHTMSVYSFVTPVSFISFLNKHPTAEDIQSLHLQVEPEGPRMFNKFEGAFTGSRDLDFI